MANVNNSLASEGGAYLATNAANVVPNAVTLGGVNGASQNETEAPMAPQSPALCGFNFGFKRTLKLLAVPAMLAVLFGCASTPPMSAAESWRAQSQELSERMEKLSRARHGPISAVEAEETCDKSSPTATLSGSDRQTVGIMLSLTPGLENYRSIRLTESPHPNTVKVDLCK